MIFHFSDDLGGDFGRFAVPTPVEQLKTDKEECILTKELNNPAQSVDSSCDNFKDFQIPREVGCKIGFVKEICRKHTCFIVF